MLRDYRTLSLAAERQRAIDREALRLMAERGCDWETAYREALDALERDRMAS